VSCWRWQPSLGGIRGVNTYYGYVTPRNPKTTMKAMTDTALHRTTNKLSPWLQCCRGEHNSTMLAPVAMWPQDDDDGHTRMSTKRQHSLQAKSSRTSLRLLNLRSGEPPLCNEPWPQTLYKGTQGCHLGTHSHSLSSTTPSIDHSSRASRGSLCAIPI
jgi:hypothetical protein